MTVAVMSALFAAMSVQPAAAGEPPCPSCPDRLPPAAGPPSNGAGSGGGGQTAVPVRPLVSLGGLTVQNGRVTVTGAVDSALAAAGNVPAAVKVSLDGVKVGVAANGSFSATTGLAAKGAIVLKAGDIRTGAAFRITIPSSAIPSSGVAAEALVQLQADKVTLIQPADGFAVVDGVAIDAAVHVAGIAGIAKLTLNGANVLAKLRIGTSSSSSSSSSSSGSSGSAGSSSGGASGAQPGSAPAPACHHDASAAVAGTAKTVNVTVTATNGASQTSTVKVKQVRSVIRIGKQFSISAFGALGIRVSSVAFNYASLRRTGTLGVTVTVRERHRYLVRDAVVMLQQVTGKPSISGSFVQMSNRLGRATFKLHVGTGALRHRLYLRVVARTPRASAHVLAKTI